MTLQPLVLIFVFCLYSCLLFPVCRLAFGFQAHFQVCFFQMHLNTHIKLKRASDPFTLKVRKALKSHRFKSLHSFKVRKNLYHRKSVLAENLKFDHDKVLNSSINGYRGFAIFNSTTAIKNIFLLQNICFSVTETFNNYTRISSVSVWIIPSSLRDV